MSIVVIGLNHRTVPLDLLERMTIEESRAPKALADIVSRPNVSEAVLLSTCNRTEVYVAAERFHGAFSDVRQFLSEFSFVPPESFADQLYALYETDASRHLFEVTAGLDSAVVGEAEILGQVRSAWELARTEDAAGPAVNLLFRHALELGKRVRTETGIGRHVASVSSAAVAMAGERLGGLADRSVLVLGAGEMGEGMVKAMASGGVSEVRIANRTWERSSDVARRVGGRPVRLADLAETLTEVDVLMTGTGASNLMLAHGDLDRAMRARRGPDGTPKPLLVVDVAVPRDVDPAAGELDGVTLLDMDDLRAFAEAGIAARRSEIAGVRGVIAEELERYSAVSSARELSPLVGELRTRAEEVRSQELARFARRLQGLDTEEWEAVEALTKGIVAKLLHGPTVEVKDAAGTPRGERLAESLRDLFDL